MPGGTTTVGSLVAPVPPLRRSTDIVRTLVQQMGRPRLRRRPADRADAGPGRDPAEPQDGAALAARTAGPSPESAVTRQAGRPGARLEAGLIDYAYLKPHDALGGGVPAEAFFGLPAARSHSVPGDEADEEDARVWFFAWPGKAMRLVALPGPAVGGSSVVRVKPSSSWTVQRCAIPDHACRVPVRGHVSMALRYAPVRSRVESVALGVRGR